MPRTILSVNDVAASLHVSAREVIRMAEQKILPAEKVRGQWQFRAGDVWNWIEQNMETLPERRRKDRHPVAPATQLLAPILRDSAIAVNLMAKTRTSILRELSRLAEEADSTIDSAALFQSLQEREAQSSTALQDGVAIPHPNRPLYLEAPVIAAARTAQPIVFGQRDGGLTDLFFLICCPSQTDHLLFLGRLCRLLIDRTLQENLRAAETAAEFSRALTAAENALCRD